MHTISLWGVNQLNIMKSGVILLQCNVLSEDLWFFAFIVLCRDVLLSVTAVWLCMYFFKSGAYMLRSRYCIWAVSHTHMLIKWYIETDYWFWFVSSDNICCASTLNNRNVLILQIKNKFWCCNIHIS